MGRNSEAYCARISEWLAKQVSSGIVSISLVFCLTVAARAYAAIGEDIFEQALGYMVNTLGKSPALTLSRESCLGRASQHPVQHCHLS